MKPAHAILACLLAGCSPSRIDEPRPPSGYLIDGRWEGDLGGEPATLDLSDQFDGGFAAQLEIDGRSFVGDGSLAAESVAIVVVRGSSTIELNGVLEDGERIVGAFAIVVGGDRLHGTFELRR